MADTSTSHLRVMDCCWVRALETGHARLLEDVLQSSERASVCVLSQNVPVKSVGLDHLRHIC